MKKLLIIPTLLSVSLLLVWCGDEENNATIEELSNNEINNICEENEWELVNRVEWWDVVVCWFKDWSFCFVDDLISWACEKWFIKFKDEDDNLTGENISEENIPDFSECDQTEKDVVCGKDWNTYFNKCYLDAAWIEEETELAHVENWECTFE